MDYSGKIVLDLGSFTGSFEKSNKFDHILKSINKTRIYIKLDIDPDSGANLAADTHRLPFTENCFDIVIANNIIEHCRDARIAVDEIYRVLKKNGIAYFTVPFLYPIHEAPHDYARYTEYGLQNLFCRFNKVEIISRGGWFSTMANFVYQTTRFYDRIYIGKLLRFILFFPLWVFVQLDRFDYSKAFTRGYFGKLVK
jgi:SAM-dependent methyltransferase